MGLFSDIVKKVKDTVSSAYGRADKAVGGYLPGGQTPSQVSASKSIPQLGSPVLKPSETQASQSFQQRTGRTPTIASGSASAQIPTGNIQENLSAGSTGNVVGVSPLSQVQAELPINYQGAIQPQGVPEGYTKTTNSKGDLVYAPNAPISMGQKIKNLIFGNYLKQNPFTGEIYLDPTTGQPREVQASTGGLEYITGVGEVSAAAKGLGLIGSTDDIIRNSKNLIKSSESALNVAKVTSKMENLGNSVVGGKVADIAAQIGKDTIGVAPKAGEIATNTKSLSRITSFINKLGTGNIIKIGGAVWLLDKIVGGTLESSAFIESDITNFVQSVGFHLDELREAGMDEEAQELYAKGVDLQDGWDSIIPFIPYLGGIIERSKITKYTADLNTVLNDFNEKKTEAEKARIDKDLSLVQDMYGMSSNEIISSKEIIDFALDPANSYTNTAKLYQQALRDAVEAQNPDNYYGENYKGTGLTGKDYDRQIYNQQSGSYTQEKFEPQSSLNFGLLHTSGYYESVGQTAPEGTPTSLTEDQKNDWAMYLYGIPYAQLTDEQKALLEKM